MPASVDEIKRMLGEKGVKLVRYLYVDLDNMIRGRVSKVESLEGDLEGGLTLAKIMQSGFSITDLVSPGTIYGPRGEVTLRPDPSTLVVLPYAESTAAMIVDQYVDDRPHEVDPRPRLKEMLSGSKYAFLVGFEPEFYILRKTAEKGSIEMFEHHLCFSTHGMQSVHGLLLDVIDALKKQGIEVEHYYPEYGSGQHELSISPYEPLQAADKLVYFRETLRGVLGKHGLYASFMPKPSETLPGTGMHVHISVWRDGSNLLFSEDDKYMLSDEGYYFIGGILKHLEEIIATTAASVNSYKRLRPNSWSSAYACWGPENREAAVRIPKPPRGREEKALRLELKFVDATANPYLALGSIIAAGLEGIEKKIDPGEPCLENPAAVPEEEREKRGWRRYPENLLDAIRGFQRSGLMRRTWGDTLVEEYYKLKKFQWDLYHSIVTDWERRVFLEAF
ncbi:MAG: glutamine synthetase family protein [Desulfurococcales archaeon]|nr:glutamine synthetase family protein [Desulfurococcales archaeon]